MTKKPKWKAAIVATALALTTAPLSVQAVPVGGTTIGGFTSPQPSCPPATCSGAGSSTVTWGIPISQPSSVHFTGIDVTGDTEGPPVPIGLVTFVNGRIATGTGISGLEMAVQAFLSQPDLLVLDFDRHVVIVNTPNTDDPEASADFLSVQRGPTFHVLEDGAATATVLGKFFDIVVPTIAHDGPRSLAWKIHEG